MKINRIQIVAGTAKIVFCFIALLIQHNSVQAQKTVSPTARLTYVASDTYDGETKSVGNNSAIALGSTYGRTKGPFATYTQSWNEKYKKSDTIQTVVLNSTRTLDMRTLSYNPKKNNSKYTVKSVSSFQINTEKVRADKSERMKKKYKMRINLGKYMPLVN